MTTNPPIAETRPHTHREHGVERSDPWYWLREREDPAVRAYLEAENAYTEAAMAHLAPLRKALYDEMLSRVQEDDASAPVPHGPWAYFTRTFEGKAYPAYCRVPRGITPDPREPHPDEQWILDLNTLAEGQDYISVALVSYSPDHRTLAFAIDVTGREIYEIRFVDLETGELLPDRIPETVADLEWAADSRTVFWVAMDHALRADRVFRRTLGTDQTDHQVFHEPDEKFRVGLHKSRSGQWIFVRSVSSETHEAWLLSAEDPTTAPRCVQPRVPGLRYAIDHGTAGWWILTNLALDDHGAQTREAPNLRLMRAPVDRLGMESWEEVVPHSADVQLLGVDVYRDHLALTERELGQSRIRVLTAEGAPDHVVELPEPICSVRVGEQPEFDSAVLRIELESMTTPPTSFAYDATSRVLTKLRQVAVPGYDPAAYTTERRWATGDDGVRVPMTLVYRRDTPRAPSTPLFLYGYGSYGATMEPRFTNPRVSLLDRGIVFCVAHPRGGGFLGRRWYEAGKYEGKQNTFTDFVTCGRALHADGLSSPGHTVISGGSAGGLLIGAVINQAPDLCTAAVAAVPFVDVLTSMLDASIPLTAGEWEEWGDPREPAAFRWIRAYSPYDNVQATAYPNLFVIAGLNDPRVQYWEPAKWVAKLRATATGGEILMRTHMGAGHAGRSGRYGYYEDRAEEYAWVLDQLGLSAPSD